MSSIKKPEQFVQSFLNEYLTHGFGTMAKRDMDILILHLMIKHNYFGNTFDYFDASRDLRISERRVRSLHQQVQLRYDHFDETRAKQMFVELIETMRFEKSTR